MFCAPSIPSLAPEIDSILYSSDKPFFSVFYETFEEPLSETFKSFYVVNVTLCEPGPVPFVQTTFVGSKKLQFATDSLCTPVALCRGALKYGARL